MAKYITLDGLGHFLEQLRSDKFKTTSNNFGIIKIGYNNGNANNDERKYPVRLNSDGKAYVNVPWVNTKLTINTNHGIINSSTNELKLALANTTKGSIEATNSDTNNFNSDKFYAIQLDTNNKLSVNVPWIDNSVTSVNNHYKPNNTSQKKGLGLYKITNDKAGHIYSTEAVIEDDIKKFNIQSNSSTEIIEKISHSALKTKINNKGLLPGKKYCITDYTVVLPSTISPAGKSVSVTSAGYIFGIIVKAFATDKLSEDAQACRVEQTQSGISGSKFGAWKIKYDINNNTEKYSWANATNGKGVIYYMEDEWGNKVPYDFKNIKFDENFTIDSNSCTNIHIKPYIKGGKQYLNNIIFVDSYSTSYINIGNNCFDIICNENVTGTEIGNNCSNINFAGRNKYNKIGNNCSNITFGYNDSHNKIGNDCSNITFFPAAENVSPSQYNKIGNNCSNITFGYYNNYNKIGNNCSNITFGKYWDYNKFVDGVSNFSIYYKFSHHYNESNNIYKETRIMDYVSSCIFNKNIKTLFLSDFCRWNSSGNDTIFAEVEITSPTGTQKKPLLYASYTACWNNAGFCGVEFINLNNSSSNEMFNLPLIKIQESINNDNGYLKGWSYLNTSRLERLLLIITEYNGYIYVKPYNKEAKTYYELN